MEFPFLAEDFAVRWSLLRPELVSPSIEHALAVAAGHIETIANQPLEAVSFRSTFLALDEATATLRRSWGYVEHLTSVCDSPALRETYRALLPRVTDFYTQLTLNEQLWSRLKAASEAPEVAGLRPIDRRLISERLADFREEGADLHPEGKERLATLNRELSALTQQFSETVLDATNAWELIVTEESRLAGLPRSAIEAARESAAEKGHAHGWRFTLHAPSMMPVLRYADDDALRREVWVAYAQLGSQPPHDNTERVRQILRLRLEKAQLLGFNDFADLVTSRRMAGSGSTATQFLQDLRSRIAGAFQAEVQSLRDFKASATGTAAAPLQPWETGYWAEKQRRAAYDFDEEAVRAYFPIDRVQTGLFTLAETLFGLRITERPTVFRKDEVEATSTIEEADASASAAGPVEVWHPEVRFYDAHDDQGRHLGSFYTDWHPREAKRAGAWMNYLRTGGPVKGPENSPQGSEHSPQTDRAPASPASTPTTSAPFHRPHLGLICGNLTKPGSGKPALMTHDEVTTIFHEFGHLLHHLLSEVPHPSLSGVNVVWDFVELPSQILENWCWEKSALDRFSGHYQSGDPLPEDLIGKMVAARNFLSASSTMRQLQLSTLDLLLHRNTAEAVAAPDLEAWLEPHLRPFRAELASPVPSLTRHFSHLFSNPTGYAAGYYSYKWAEVLDADAFTRFQHEGILNPTTGRALRDTILSQGNSAAAQELFRAFMGRDPDPEALLRRSGLAG